MDICTCEQSQHPTVLPMRDFDVLHKCAGVFSHLVEARLPGTPLPNCNHHNLGNDCYVQAHPFSHVREQMVFKLKCVSFCKASCSKGAGHLGKRPVGCSVPSALSLATVNQWNMVIHIYINSR
jgi:hypothetical protein